MGKTSKSPKAVLLTAHRVGRERLRTYSHLFSPKKFTQPQLFACLVLKEFLRLDYRKLSALLADCPKLAAAIDLEREKVSGTFFGLPRGLTVLSRSRRRMARFVHDSLPNGKRCQEPFLLTNSA